MNSPRSLLVIALSLAGLLASSLVDAASPFSADVTIAAPLPTGVSYATSDTLFQSLRTSSLLAILPAYNDLHDAVQVAGNYRGVNMDFGAAASSPDVTLNIPSLGIAKLFNSGGSRDANAQLLYDYLKSGRLLSDLSQQLAQTSPIDPIAGNPNSLMSTMAAAEFDLAFTSQFSSIARPEADSASAASADKMTQVGIGLEYGQMNQGGSRVSNLTIPFSYAIRNDFDPRRQLLLRMPLTVLDVEGAKAYQLGFGASYRLLMSQYWSLVPSVNYAFTAATDLGSTAQMASAGLTSTYYWRRPGYDVGIGNMLGFATTMPFSYGGYDYDPNISNTVLRNGVMWSMPTVLSGRKLHFETAVVDTRFFGSKLYADNYQELRFSLGTSRSSSAASLFRAGLALRHMKSDTGFNLEFGYWL